MNASFPIMKAFFKLHRLWFGGIEKIYFNHRLLKLRLAVSHFEGYRYQTLLVVFQIGNELFLIELFNLSHIFGGSMEESVFFIICGKFLCRFLELKWFVLFISVCLIMKLDKLGGWCVLIGFNWNFIHLLKLGHVFLMRFITCKH